MGITNLILESDSKLLVEGVLQGGNYSAEYQSLFDKLTIISGNWIVKVQHRWASGEVSLVWIIWLQRDSRSVVYDTRCVICM